MKTYADKDLDAPTTVRSSILITSVRVEPGPRHDYVHIWNRGGKAGTLVVDAGDGERVAERLIPNAEVHTEERKGD